MTPKPDSAPAAANEPSVERFTADRRGAIAIWFALSVLLLAVLVMGAIDLTRLLSTRTRLQDSLDASAVAVARMGPQTDAAMDLAGDVVMRREYREGQSTLIVSGFKNGPENSVVAEATATLEPVVLDLVFKGPMRLRVVSEVKRGQEAPVELVMVLDTTKSMEGARLAGLKTAAKNLVAKMTPAGVRNVRIGVVPFGQYVNVGVAARNQPWVDVPADWVETVPKTCSPKTQTTCTGSETYTCTSNNDGVITTRLCTRNTGCTTKPVNPPQEVCSGPSTKAHVFKGCIGSPAYPKNVADDDTARRYPGYLDVACGAEITPLTSSASKVTSAVNALKASGNTYIPAGLAWGFNMLSSPVPLTDAAPYDSSGANLKPRKAMILMTDGANTLALRPPSNGQHLDPNATYTIAQTNGFTAELCRNIKAKKIEVFTVAFEVTDPSIKAILQACATDANHYYDAADAGKLDTAFQNIADALRHIYISR